MISTDLGEFLKGKTMCQGDESQNNVENGRVTPQDEYTQCWENWRFFLGFRGTLLVLSFTIMSGLLYAFFANDKQGNPPASEVRLLIASLGIIYTLGIIIIENRNRQMYAACVNRARAIEEPQKEKGTRKSPWKLFLFVLLEFCARSKTSPPEPEEHNLANLLEETSVTLLSWHTLGIFLIYFSVGLVWVFLFFVTLFFVINWMIGCALIALMALLVIISIKSKKWAAKRLTQKPTGSPSEKDQ